MKVLTIFGTRPEAIKMAPVIQQLRCYPQQVQVCVCVTAQHREMLDQVLDLFSITPDVDLNLMQNNQSPTQVAARVLLGVDSLLDDLRPEWVLVQGDTTTAMAAAIAAHYQRVRVGHVEAGLRTYDRTNPFPEEANRVIVDHVSDLHFAPTERARQNLRREGIPDARIHVTGNTVIDALYWVAEQPLAEQIRAWFCKLGLDEQTTDDEPTDADQGTLYVRRSAVGGRRTILVTAHRRENFGSPLRHICIALRELVRRRDDVQVVYPVHLNPNVWEPVHEFVGDVPRIRLLPPVDYLTLVHLMKHSFLILTDSGGIQEEAPSLGVPVLVLRKVTERPEAVGVGAARVVGTDPERILVETERLLDDPVAHESMARAGNPYGDGNAAKRIVTALITANLESVR